MTFTQKAISAVAFAFAMGAAGACVAQAETAPQPTTPAAPVSHTALTLNIEGVRSDKGQIMAALLKADRTTGTARRVNGTTTSPIVGTTTITFNGLEPGEYAVQLFHDENGNGEMDSNLFGIPSEGYAFSNRARGNFGPPKFEQMKVTIGDVPAQTAAVMNY
jgi:uncharacterized protein (DUF2141 family)